MPKEATEGFADNGGVGMPFTIELKACTSLTGAELRLAVLLDDDDDGCRSPICEFRSSDNSGGSRGVHERPSRSIGSSE